MYFKQFYLGCLAHASYLIGSEGEAVVVDPQRDVDQYVDEADALGLRIVYVIETHLHADFVSGHRELASKTGAQIVFGAEAKPEFAFLPVRDGDRLAIGSLSLRILETPGHTPESISILVEDSADPSSSAKVLTGDTLFVGDVGRPDLAGSRGISAEQMAGMLYDSLYGKLLTLPDAVEVYPAHGAGSLCGRHMSSETSSTIGEQKRFNYALQFESKADFIAAVTENLPDVPSYFPKDAELNRRGAPPLGDLPRHPALSPDDLDRCTSTGGIVLDVRPAAEFGNGHVPGAMNIGLGGQFASWAGTLVAIGTPIVVVADSIESVDEAVVRLARVGIDTVVGYLDRGMLSWAEAGRPVVRTPQMPIDELKMRIDEGDDLQIIDVRRPPEYAGGHVPRAASAPLAALGRLAHELDASRPTAIVCASGYRSSAATSVLERAGFATLFNVVGGTNAWCAAGNDVETDAGARVP